MENFWYEFSVKVKDAFQDAEKKRKRDFAMLAKLPQVLNFLKDMSGEDLLLLLDQARKIKKRKNPKFPPINADFYETQKLLSLIVGRSITGLSAFV